MDNPEEFEHPESELYFSIGQNFEDQTENNYCWIYNGREFRKAKGGTHGSNFPDLFSPTSRHEDPSVYRGWADTYQEMISVVVPTVPGQISPKNSSDLPTKLRVILGDYWPGYDIKVF
jgi:hypothetical protein